jgi:hypothetical protein
MVESILMEVFLIVGAYALTHNKILIKFVRKEEIKEMMSKFLWLMASVLFRILVFTFSRFPLFEQYQANVVLDRCEIDL